MPDLTRDADRAMGAAYSTWAFGPSGAATKTPMPAAEAFRAGWQAGREYERHQQAQAEADRLVMRGFRLLGCPHTRSCTSVDDCGARTRGQR